MNRLIDADLLEEILDVNIQKLQDEIDDARTYIQKEVYEAQLFSTMEMIRVIKEQPTAFNVEKVVEQLDEKSQLARPVGWVSPYEIILTKDVMKIVKAGGLDE